MFNVQSPRSEGYDEITGTHGRFSLVKSSIVNAVKAGIYTEIHFVPMKLNVEDIDSIIAFAKEKHKYQCQQKTDALHQCICFQYAHLFTQAGVHNALNAHGCAGDQRTKKAQHHVTLLCG